MESDEHLERYMRRIRFLESRLARYDDVTPFDSNAMADEDENDYGTIDDEYKEYREKKKESIFIDEEEESHQRVVCQIGEGATSIAYKAIDERTNEEMCEKVLKVEEGKTYKTPTKNLKFFSNCCIQASASA
ncbi:hypothetical protein M9Y10_040071 [Tritrichomonas musculus]|uniref:Protein kinase domain-containing protein n=1 Tax=Tritrichomonas musculus TaxID=1915356 RepID=A0ABR2GQ94_9EUKA